MDVIDFTTLQTPAFPEFSNSIYGQKVFKNGGRSDKAFKKYLIAKGEYLQSLGLQVSKSGKVEKPGMLFTALSKLVSHFDYAETFYSVANAVAKRQEELDRFGVTEERMREIERECSREDREYVEALRDSYYNGDDNFGYYYT